VREAMSARYGGGDSAEGPKRGRHPTWDASVEENKRSARMEKAASKPEEV